MPRATLQCTDRLRENLLKEKDVLLQELHHRVANSLQIIASVLMQSARKVVSDETRTHLYDAHQRVMSVRSPSAATRGFPPGRCRDAALSGRIVRKHWRFDDTRPRAIDH